MYDIHTHLYWDTYDKDREAVLKRAKEAGVEKMLVIGCTVEESEQAVKLAEKYPELFASVGIHPHEFKEEKDLENLAEKISALEKMAQERKVIAIGECGLDYYVRKENEKPQQTYVGRTTDSFSDGKKTLQKEGFSKQLDLTEKLKLPVIVHCRPARNDSQAKRSDSGGDAYGDMFEILKSKNQAISAFILHCYMGDTEITKQFLEIPNVYFSFTGNITYPVKKDRMGTKDDLAETVKLIPLERIFTETDCPFLAPQEKRGERNEPAWVVAVAERIASLHATDKAQIEKATAENFEKVFGKV